MPNYIFTVDVEEYYHAENIYSSLSKDDIRKLPDRGEIGLNKIIDLLQETENKATFFVLGCLAEKNKTLIKRIHKLGYEIASHGYSHKPLLRHTRETFKQDLDRSIKILSDITQDKIIGYRSPSFSLSKGQFWIFDVLKDYGITYDSSISFSFFRSNSWSLPENMHNLNLCNGIMEFPISFLRAGPLKLPIGGGYFRLCPYSFTEWALRQLSDKDLPAVFYTHPWALDTGQPRLRLPFLKGFRHYINLHKTEHKLQKLLSSMKFIGVYDFLKTINKQS
jgi:polysaccharide deacetylase family protein (PEP-CTERM system associated)